jgi:hypothetical protein
MKKVARSQEGKEQEKPGKRITGYPDKNLATDN